MIDKCWNLKSETENIYRFVSGMMYEYLAAKSSFFQVERHENTKKKKFRFWQQLTLAERGSAIPTWRKYV